MALERVHELFLDVQHASANLADRVVVLGNRPATVVENLQIDLPRPRDRDALEFARYVTHLSSWLGVE